MDNPVPPTRRTLLGCCTLLGGSALVTGCGDTTSPTPMPDGPPPAAPEPSGQGLPAMASTDLPIGTRSSITVSDPLNGREPTVLLYRSGEDTVVAYSNECPHQGCAVSGDSPGEEFHCPCHGSRFAPADGAVLAGPARTGLTRYAAAIKDGQILVYFGR